MVIDLTFLNLNPSYFSFVATIIAGLLGIFFIFLILKFYLEWFWLPARRAKYLSSVPFMLLAIDIPKNNEQTPKAVENIFSTLSGILSGPNLYEKYWLGVHQLSFSLEIVSSEGYIQFIIYLPTKYRDVVEAAFFAQYPEAEIMEISDYTNIAPKVFPSDTYNIWGTDIKLGNTNPYPIRTYPRFEHTLSQESKGPMASLLEVMSRLRKGEHIWLQWVITPTSDDWKKESIKEVKKIVGEKGDQSKDIGYYITYPFLSFMKFLGDTIIVQAEGAADTKTEKDNPNKMLYLTGGQREILQGIEEKMAKIGFLVKGRLVYLAKREIFDKNRGVAPVIGSLNQYNTLNMNFFAKVKTTTTTANYFRVEQRLAKKQTKIINAYCRRIGDKKFGNNPFILNIEELASVYHFPEMQVKAPMVKKIDSKRSEPPSALPIDSSQEQQSQFIVMMPNEITKKNNIAPSKISDKSEKNTVQVVLPDELDANTKNSPPINLPF